MEKSNQIDQLVVGTAPAVYHTMLAARLARGQGMPLTVGQIEVEARISAKTGDIERSATIENWISNVCQIEADACGIDQASAKYLLLRGVAASRILDANPEGIYGVAKRGATPYVGFKQIILALAVCQDDGPGDLPGTMEEAQFMVAETYHLCQPSYCRALSRYVADLQANRNGDWHQVQTAHKRAVDSWSATSEDRLYLAKSINTVLEGIVACAKADVPNAFIYGNDLGDFVAGFCPEVRDLVDASVEAV